MREIDWLDPATFRASGMTAEKLLAIEHEVDETMKASLVRPSSHRPLLSKPMIDVFFGNRTHSLHLHSPFTMYRPVMHFHQSLSS
jgi:hypothetical protein